MRVVTCMDDGTKYTMDARTPYEALAKLRYTLDIARKDPGAVINKTDSGAHLYMDHGGKTYAIRNL